MLIYNISKKSTESDDIVILAILETFINLLTEKNVLYLGVTYARTINEMGKNVVKIPKF